MSGVVSVSVISVRHLSWWFLCVIILGYENSRKKEVFRLSETGKGNGFEV